MLKLILVGALCVAAPNAALYVALERSRRQLPVCDEDDEDALPIGVRLAAFVAECAASVAAVALSALGPIVPTRRGDAAAATRIVLLHGWGQSRGAMSVLARRLADSGFAIVHFSYASGAADVPAAADRLRGLLADLRHERPGPVVLLGFGLGGLVARYCVRRHHLPGVRRLLTLGTAHQGTLLAPRWWPGVARLRPDSDFMRHLAAADRAPEQFESTAIQSELDATILPPDHAYYPAAFNVIVRDTGHFSLLFSRRIFALVAENLGPGEPL